MPETEHRSFDKADEVREFPDGRANSNSATEPAGGGTADAVIDAFEVVEKFGAAWGAHDLEATLAMIADDCVFEATGPAPDGVRHVGREAIRGAWQTIFDDTASGFEVEDTMVAGDRVVQTWRYSWDGGHVRGVDLFRVRDGKVAEKFAYVKG